jgi:pimeloyl-ACP methyl ester carboxylesterase
MPAEIAPKSNPQGESMRTLKLSAIVVFTTALVVGWELGDAPAEEKKKSDDAARPRAAKETKEETMGKYVTVNGLKMYYEIHGTGKPLVMLHGAFGWATLFPTLAKDRQVIAIELQGHGHTADLDRPLSFEQMADDTAALLKELKIEQADFFGYSMGGTVALGVAIRHPKLVRKLAINGSHYAKMKDAYEPETFKQFESLPADFAPKMLKDHYDEVAPDPKQWPVLVGKIKKLGADFKGYSPEDMQSIKTHVLVTIGDRDGVRPEHAVEMYRLIPHAQLAVFPGADHFLLFQNPDKILPTIAAFLDEPLPEPKKP